MKITNSKHMSLTMFRAGNGKWGKRVIAAFGLLTAGAMIATYTAPLFSGQ